MSKVYAIMNQKGGAGKTTTAGALAAGLTLLGFSVLSVDLDAQRNFTYTAKPIQTTLKPKPENATILGVLMGEINAEDAIQHTESGVLIPASKALSGADAVLTDTGKEYKLREALEPIRDKYDFIILDTPPALGILSINALTACDSVIIPAQADIYSLQGIEQLADTMKPVKKYCNPALTIEGILLTRYSPRSVLSREVAELAERIAETLGTRVFKTTIREAVAVKEAQIKRKSLYGYAPNAKVTGDYTNFIEELVGEES